MRTCPACGCHVLVLEPSCPHCHANLAQPGGRARQVGASVGLGLGLSLAGCVTAEAVYGVPVTDTDTFTTSETTDETTDETTETDGGVCELPQNEELSGETATFNIRNDRDAAIYVLPYSSFICNYSQVEIDVGGEPVLWAHAGTYPYDCSANLCDYGCSNGGAMGLIINPGAEAQVEWNGALWSRTPLSEACQEAAACENNPPGETCDVRSQVDGEYTVRVNLTDFCPLEDECMACTDGVCEVFFDDPFLGQVSESFEAVATFPEGAEFVIQ